MQIKKLLPFAACLVLAAAQSDPEEESDTQEPEEQDNQEQDSSSSEESSGSNSLTDALGDVSELSQFVEFVGGFDGLVEELSNLENITVLAPSNEAFESFLNNSLEIDLENEEVAQAVASYHVLNGTYLAENVPEEVAFIHTRLSSDNPSANITGGQVVKAVASDDEVTFISGLERESVVTQADIEFDNGVIHVIDRVLTVPLNVTYTAVAANKTAFVGALQEVGDPELLDTVDNTPDVTIFAPTNEAFQAIGSTLANISTEDLADTLTYHVVAGTVGYSSTLENGTSLETANGENITITVVDGDIFVNSAQVVLPDLLVANGVVHCIDNVLNPANATAAPDEEDDAQEPAFSDATSATEIPFTSSVTAPSSVIPSPTGGAGGGGGGDSEESGEGEDSMAVSAKGASMGMAALFGGIVALYNM